MFFDELVEKRSFLGKGVQKRRYLMVSLRRKWQKREQEHIFFFPVLLQELVFFITSIYCAAVGEILVCLHHKHMCTKNSRRGAQHSTCLHKKYFQILHNLDLFFKYQFKTSKLEKEHSGS